jgi:7,8-dihydropterin-6-yl-methyl-4-(beta-D-ribofuranosyl)aminobenzene 5'-phosphate synthase
LKNKNNTSKSDLEKADHVEIITIVDNYTNAILASSEGKSRIITRATEKFGGEKALLAEHGLSLLIKVFKGDQTHMVLFDGSRSKAAIRYNLMVQNIDLSPLEAVILSHGHGDHYGGLFAVPGYAGRRGIPLIAHPDAFLHRYRKQSDGTMLKKKRLTEQSLTKAGYDIIKSK